MIRKALPVVFASALVLTACNSDKGALPDNNETPMQELERDLTPNERVGPNLDGLDDNNRDNGGVMERDRKGIIEENNRDQMDNNRDDGLNHRGARDDNTMQGEMNGNDTAPDGVLRNEDRKVR
ncbi:hypothetical protein DV702_16410 [Sporosarcina sp. PTS2304]|uniref:hypothetical protein n=1 Tax=Sporosarcina sp. PTS2304 TaxID=2283194 RepID=UPI000E0D0A2E|nr:hypothetical protein [Sporosarcina sp. PTS2304]AXI01163.1 hypothetical protein DV702_16410 [Sporosarcina sp. PTS2304]